MEFSTEEFITIRDIIYKRTGLFFSEKKIYLIKKRIKKRIETLSLESFQDYLRLIKYRDNNQFEFEILLNTITTNETYFFREFEQLQTFAEYCVPALCEEKNKKKDTKFNIWSAGCSTGEEAYTLSIIILEMLEQPERWKKKIIASDINQVALARAKSGIYEDRAIKNVPEKYLNEYFIKAEGKYHVTDELKKNVSFRLLNLYDSAEMDEMHGFDFIFCRNVLIYFDGLSQKKVVNSFYKALNPGGYIYLGHAEAMSRMSSAFSVKKVNGSIIYQKPGEET